jgi:hypothetical protein
VNGDTGECRILQGGDFELLGAAIADTSFCSEHGTKKGAKASALLDSIGAMEDPQVAVRLMRNCAGACKITHSMRMTPLRLRLQSFDNKVRSTFSAATALHPDNQQWGQACRGLGHGGLGPRSTLLHSEAAFLASSAAASNLCHSLDASFQLRADNPASEFGTALAAFNAKLPETSQISAPEVAGTKQKDLSLKLDKAGHEERLASLCAADRATLISECQDGTRDFWSVVPSKALAWLFLPRNFLPK